MPVPKMPESLKPHVADYRPAAWQDYDLSELGAWVYLLAMRSQQRTNPEKRAKDRRDAQAYLDMMQARLNALE